MQELIKNLTAAQSEMSHAAATGNNPHFKSKYVPYEVLMDYVKPVLNNHGIYVQQVSHETEGGVCVETVLHGHGHALSSGKVFVKADKQTPQGYGSALTYARRYSLSLATSVGADKDDDGNSAEADQGFKKTYPAKKITQAPKSAPDGKFSLQTAAGSIITTVDSPSSLLAACRQHLSKSDDDNCQAIYFASKESIIGAHEASIESDSETHAALTKLIEMYA
jgi:hypothetical protein